MLEKNIDKDDDIADDTKKKWDKPERDKNGNCKDSDFKKSGSNVAVVYFLTKKCCRCP